MPAMLMLAMAGLQALGAAGRASAQNKAMKVQEGILRANAALELLSAQDAIDRGAQAEGVLRYKYANVMGEQENNMAANGVDLSFGSPLAVLQDTQYFGERDTATTRYNAQLESYAHKQEASNLTAEADSLRAQRKANSPFKAAAGSLLGSAMQAPSAFGIK